ncbi:hypothetical protein D3C77_654780 [compost metagenome]
MQVFDHFEGERAALEGLPVEIVQRSDFIFMLLYVSGKCLDYRLGLFFGLLAETGKYHLIQIDVVDKLLALAAGVFDLVT